MPQCDKIHLTINPTLTLTRTPHFFSILTPRVTWSWNILLQYQITVGMSLLQEPISYIKLRPSHWLVTLLTVGSPHDITSFRPIHYSRQNITPLIERDRQSGAVEARSLLHAIVSSIVGPNRFRLVIRDWLIYKLLIDIACVSDLWLCMAVAQYTDVLEKLMNY